MAKIRIYELATKMGLDNKDVVAKLQQAGIEVKNHMSAIEEDVAQKFEAAQMAGGSAAAEAEELPLFPWNASPKDFFVTIRPREMAGRRFTVVEDQRPQV